MKGIVLSLGLPRKRRFRLPDLKGIIKRHGVLMVFAVLLLAGLAFGAAYAYSADRQTLRSLDFLFTTNLESRLGKGAFGTMCACFASDFVFLLSAYFLGAAPWGIPFLPALVCFKGFKKRSRKFIQTIVEEVELEDVAGEHVRAVLDALLHHVYVRLVERRGPDVVLVREAGEEVAGAGAAVPDVVVVLPVRPKREL